ncbi:MAG: tetratricopeptide repeat protein, partial [Bacteroidota bacterium]|nr:tetratricopeptide repeat protein [Bacteroidota bacterium]
MVKLLVCFLTALFLYQPPDAPKKSKPDYKQLFIRAERLSNLAKPSDKTDQEALKNYLAVVDILSHSHADDHFLIHAYVSTGTFMQVLNRQKESVGCFKNAIDLKKRLPDLKDSVLFKPLVYCGNAYYRLDKTDSAALFYNRAENIAEKYPKVSELERLYNTLGVIAYSSGNYSKSITYYNKAISTLTGQSSYENLFLVSYKNNLASAYKKLQQYETALEIYKGLLSYHIETDKLLHNIGSAYLAMGNSAAAINYLLKVKYTDQKKLNDLGRAYFEKKDYANAINYLQQATDLYNRANHGYKNTDHSITLKYLGDLWFEQGQTLKALSYYQQSINNLLFNFHSDDIYRNPSAFTSVFNTMELLDALKAKAAAFKKLHAESGKIKDLEASLQTYLAFYKLANYIEKVYDNDDSRLLISDKKYASHEQAIGICLQLFRLTGKQQYINEAFSLDEENKANTLALYLRESKLKAKSGIPVKLLQEENILKQNVTRLSIAAQDEKDSTKLTRLNGWLNEFSIRLLKVQKKINGETSFGRLKFLDKSVSIPALQKIIPSNSAILSYHVSESGLICFIITHDQFAFFNTAIKPGFYSSLKAFYTLAQSTEQNNRKEIETLGKSFYALLLKPAENHIGGKKNLMIIPDNELNYLPFELITDGHGQNLLSRFTITYNYSCTILQNSAPNTSKQLNGLGMAPVA